MSIYDSFYKYILSNPLLNKYRYVDNYSIQDIDKIVDSIQTDGVHDVMFRIETWFLILSETYESLLKTNKYFIYDNISYFHLLIYIVTRLYYKYQEKDFKKIPCIFIQMFNEINKFSSTDIQKAIDNKHQLYYNEYRIKHLYNK